MIIDLKKLLKWSKSNIWVISILSTLGFGGWFASFTDYGKRLLDLPNVEIEMRKEYNFHKGEDMRVEKRVRELEEMVAFLLYCNNTNNTIISAELDRYKYDGYELEETNASANSTYGDWYTTLKHKYGKYKAHVTWRNSDSKFIYNDYNRKEKILKRIDHEH